MRRVLARWSAIPVVVLLAATSVVARPSEQQTCLLTGSAEPRLTCCLDTEGSVVAMTAATAEQFDRLCLLAVGTSSAFVATSGDDSRHHPIVTATATLRHPFDLFAPLRI